MHCAAIHSSVAGQLIDKIVVTPAGSYWSSSSTSAFVSTYVLAFIGGPLYLLMAIVLVLCKPAVQSGNSEPGGEGEGSAQDARRPPQADLMVTSESPGPAPPSDAVMMDEVDARLRTTALSHLSPASTDAGPASPEPSRPPYTSGGAWSPSP